MRGIDREWIGEIAVREVPRRRQHIRIVTDSSQRPQHRGAHAGLLHAFAGKRLPAQFLGPRPKEIPHPSRDKSRGRDPVTISASMVSSLS